MQYLVTGGAGFIGSHLVDALHQAGHSVRIVDDLSTGSLAHKPAAVEFVHGDIADAGLMADAMAGVDGCFHLAAVASVERGTLDWLGSHRTNLTGTISVFDAARRHGGVPVVYASSAAVYGDNPHIPLLESDLPRPLSAYGADKYGCELHGAVANCIHRVPNYGLRFFNVYGPRQDPRSPYSGVITIFGNRMQANEPITINGDGYHSRDFIYVGDIVAAVITAMEHCRQQVGSDVFNVCTGRETNVIDLAEELAGAFGYAKKFRFGPPRPGDPRTSIGDPSKAERVLGFRATTGLATGLRATFERLLVAA
jgi:UDP-glucose 4-epimerase